MRPADARARWLSISRKPSCRNGACSCRMYALNATIAPIVVVALDHEPAAEEEHEREPERAAAFSISGAQRPRMSASRTYGPLHLPGVALQQAELAALGGEGLDDADAADALVDDRRDLG